VTVRTVFLSLFFFSTLVRGATETKSLQEVQEKINGERKLLLETEIKKRGILGALYDINRDLSRLGSDIEAIEAQLQTYQKNIESYARIIVRLERIRDRQKALLNERLRALYKLGFKGYAELLLSSETSSDFSRNMKFLKIIAKKDEIAIENYKKSLGLLARQQTLLRKQVKTYIQFQQNLTIQKNYFAEEKEKQLTILSQVDNDRETHLEALKEWREAGLKLEEKLAQLGMTSEVNSDFRKGSFVENKGKLAPPVYRQIVQKYGIEINERFQTRIFNKGLFFAAPEKDRVFSIFFGKVAFAGWIDGYGKTIIIDHGDHYYSLYAHNSSLQKKTGDEVIAGETIAQSGDSASLRGPGLYMEIRHFSESLDPLPWLDLSKMTSL